ncbi:unnamed protein product [Fusarium graminearum]|uniref:Uncharacterized protein n=1 Tax=Gibberella zeae TaxID=5518 RepID=A0A4U9F0B5_GIBZA|nr:unnamed protein product [Fusarium graminearum]CAF3484535.1 unnamed protein product [Fusarium graminearum]CAF3494935.1 unnamed protein product [Fusarium graminearum]CAG1976311.1 unnamed protein product [Fusarium graminearum]CAG1987705.1 unnamed protein product [Fusarium graminearum]
MAGKTRTGQGKPRTLQKTQSGCNSTRGDFRCPAVHHIPKPRESKKSAFPIAAVNGNSSDDGLGKGPWTEPSLGGDFTEQSLSKVWAKVEGTHASDRRLLQLARQGAGLKMHQWMSTSWHASFNGVTSI